MTKTVKVIPFGGPSYNKEKLMEMDPVRLRGLLRERVHHNIEVPLYDVLLKDSKVPKPSFGLQPQLVYEVWKERGYSTDAPDIKWAEKYLDIAKKIRSGVSVEWQEPIPTPFTEEEMEVVKKLIYGRRSLRNWLDKPVPDELIEKILDAGRAAPIGCNLDEVCFIVLKPEEHKMIWSDISTKNSVIIVICYDKRIPEVVAQNKFVPHNAGFDAAAAADHMLLMAHALGLGGVWLSKTIETDVTKSTGEIFRKEYGLPDYIEVALHIAVGWPAIGTIKTDRMPLSEMILSKDSK